MSNSGYRGRNFGPRGARTNGPANGFNGPRFPHPSFNHPRPPHRLPGPEKWIERPNYAPWQQTKTFHPPPQFRGNLQFRPNGRGRAVGGRGIVRFSSPGRPPAPQFCMGFVRNPIPRPAISQDEKPEATKSAAIPQPPLLGSEEERRQKITETADKLKQKLSSITEEELTNFWEDDLSVLPNSNGDEQNTRDKGIPVLRHGPPELDLTFTDFKDIGRVDCNTSKFDDVDSISNDEILISFEQKSTDNVTSTNDEVTIIHESGEEPLTILDSPRDREESDRPNLLPENEKGQEQIPHELSDFECGVENFQPQPDNVVESPAFPTLNDPPASNLNQTAADSLPGESANDLVAEKCLDATEIEATSVAACSSANDQDGTQVDLPPNQSSAQVDGQDARKDISQDAPADGQRKDAAGTKVEDKQLQDNSQQNVCQDSRYPNPANLPDANTQQSRPFNPPNQEIHSNAVCGSTSPGYASYNEIHKANDDKKSSTSTGFQPRVFNVPPRFAPRGGGGPRCRWTFQQNGNNPFFRGPQRLPFHGNRMSPPRHLGSFKPTDLIPVGFDPRAPPPFSPNVPAPSHDSQHNKLVPFSTNDLPPAFDPSEPPPNIRPKSATEPPNIQENMQPMPAVDSRGQPVNIAQPNLNVMQPPPVFNSRGPPPRMPNVSGASSEKLPEFNPQQPPPKIHKRDETLQPPPIFDPRLSSQERSNLIAPLDAPRPSMMPLNLMETSPVADFNIGPVTPNFPQLPPPPINIPTHQPFIPNVPINFQPILSRPSNGQGMMREFTLPPPPVSIAKVPLPPPKEPSIGANSNPSQTLNMDDGLEDMQEAMEFAKQIMNMSEERKTESATSPAFSELPLTTSEIPIPNDRNLAPGCSSMEETLSAKKQKKKENKSKKGKSTVICGPELMVERQEELEAVDEEQAVQNPSKSTEEMLSADQIRPKVVFNLNSKTKKIQKTEEWHRTAVNVSENREEIRSQQSAAPNSSKQRTHSRKYSSESKRSTASQAKEQPQQKESSSKPSSSPSIAVTSSSSAAEKSTDPSHRPKSCAEDSSKSQPRGIATPISSSGSAQKKSKKEGKKESTRTSESSWKNRVISRFLKMSKNDICNMVNNSSLRKFDIAMKHLVKERRSSLSLKMRNTEDEKMKEYDREEFMSQLNAMLDPSAVVGITDLPTEFIHHLSEVLHLDPMPFDSEPSEPAAPANVDEVAIVDQVETLKLRTSECSNEEDLRAESCVEYPEPRSVGEEPAADEFPYEKDDAPIRCPLTSDFSVIVSREDTNSSHRSLPNKLTTDVEGVHGKKQQPLFNEADLDDILSEVTERTRSLPSATSLAEPTEKTTESPSFVQTVTEAFGYDLSEMPTRTAADLDDIFSAGIARVKLFGKSSGAECGVSRTRKSNSEDRNTFRSERYERWNRKERDDPDTFRNLTKEEWEAKYGSTNAATTASFVARKSVSSSTENLSKDSSSRTSHAPRHCSSDSPMRNSSMSPMTCEFASAHDFDGRYPTEEEEARRERAESSSETMSTSSSDTDEETVSPNVTKLLKVIKEKEKIAKKRSINETIRDEVAAEIEKKWKEKSKHKERKSRKREKRKKDKREKRRKEKERRKKRRRNSYSNSSKSMEQVDGFRLLTEDEIKKEVVVKVEPVNSEENVSLGNGINDTCGVPPSTTSQVESQSSRVEKEQTPGGAAPCDTVASQPKSKPAIVPTMQPKTKAQLKQMPENTEQRQVPEKVAQVTEKVAQVPERAAQVTKNPGTVDTEKARDASETTSRDTEAAKSSSEATSSQQIKVSLNVREADSLNHLHAEGSTTSAAPKTPLPSSASNSSGEGSSSNQASDEKMLASCSAAAAESKGGSYKKIDIKAYKERALQRRLKEQSTSTESSGNSAALAQEPQHALPASKSCKEELKTTGSDASAAQSKDVRVSKVRFASTSAEEDCAKEAKKKRTTSEADQKCPDTIQKSKECSIGGESKSCDEKSAPRPGDCSTDILKDSGKGKEAKKGDGKSEELVSAKEKSKGVSRKKKSKKASADPESSKFKHIRSEGSKELKLKKEKARKSGEKKKRDSKSTSTEKHAEKPSAKNALQGPEESSNASTNIVVPTEIEKPCNRDVRDHSSNPEAPPSQLGSNLESTPDEKPALKEPDTWCTVEQKDEESPDCDKETMDTDKTVTSQTTEAIGSDRSLVDEKLGANQLPEYSPGCSPNTSPRWQSEPTSIPAECKGLVKLEDEKKGAEIKEDAAKDVEGSFENLNSQEDASGEQMDSSISVEGAAESAASDCGAKELHLLSERIDVDIEKTGTMINVKNLIAVGKDDHSNMETEMDDRKPKEKFASLLHERLKNESGSPDSPSSPFKGFLADSVDEDVCQASQLDASKVNTTAPEGNSREDSNKWLEEPCLADKLVEERASSDKDVSEKTKKMEEDKATAPGSTSAEEQSNVADKTQDDNSNAVDNVKVGSTMEEGDASENTDEACKNDGGKQEKALSVGDMDSRDIFDEDNEPFIVLDEYIDDGDGKSIEKLSNFDLDLEECIARDADIFASKCLREEKEDTTSNVTSAYFNSIDFKDLAEFEKDIADTEENRNTATFVNETEDGASEENPVLPSDFLASIEKSAKVTTDVVSSTSEANVEASSQIPKSIDSIDSIVSEIAVEGSQNVISTTSKDIASQSSATPESSVAEKRRSEEEETPSCGDVAENDSQETAQGCSVANEILSTLSDAAKPATEAPFQKSTQQASTRGTKVEFAKLNKQQESQDSGRRSLPNQTRTSADRGNDSSVGNGTVKRLTKSSERERNDALRKIKNKSRMKHKKRKCNISGKMAKEGIKSDTVQMKCPSTKEAIMARMIEIDVEIHKLMTEKMTLYQMLTSDAISSENNLQQNNVIHEEKRAETPVYRPRTPSALMSQLIQNIETSPVADQRGKSTAEPLSRKGSPTNSLRTNKPKGLFKPDHRAEKKGSCTSTCGSDDDEIVPRAVVGAKPVSRKRKRQSFERAMKRLELELESASNRDAGNVTGEKKQANDATRLPAKKANAKQPPLEQDVADQLAEGKLPHDIGKLSVQQTEKKDSIPGDKGEQLKCKESEKIVEPAELRISRVEIVREKIKTKLIENTIGDERLTEKNADVNSLEKPMEGKTSERSSIYSDDSTWDSLLHASSVEEQKKPATGLALLEETYRKEMAKTRKVKAAARKKKKKKLQSLLETVHVLTPDEEELPLSTLYVRKLHQKKKLLNCLEQHAKQQADEDPRLWKNVVEVINAVAENRAGTAYVDVGADGEHLGSDASRVRETDESKEDAENKEEHLIDPLMVRKIKEVCVALCADVKERKDAASANSKEKKGKDLHLLSGKSQEHLSNEYFQQDLEVSVTSQTSKAPCDTSTSVAKSCAEQHVKEPDNLESNQLAPTGDSDSCVTEASLSTAQNPSSVAEKPEKTEERPSTEQKVADIEKNSEEPARSESVIASVQVERSSDNSMEFTSDKNPGTVNAFTSEEDPDSKVEGPSNGNVPDSSVPCETDKTPDKSGTEGSKTCASQAEPKAKEAERFDKTSSEENNNQNCTSVSSLDDSAETSKSDELFLKKSQKRKRGSSKTPLRRSSRYAEEPSKRIKMEADLSSTELEAQERNLGMQFPSISSTSLSSCEEVESIWMNPRKSRNVQKVGNRKRCTPAEIEVLYSSSESLKGGKRHKQHTMSEMMNCVVKVVDCKRTLLNQNAANPCALQKGAVSRVNTPGCPNTSSQEDSSASSMQSTSTKDSLTVCAKQSTPPITPTVPEHPQSQASKLTTKKSEDATKPGNDQLNCSKAKSTVKPAKVDSPVNDKEDCVVDPDVEVMPVLTKEPGTADVTHPGEKPDIEIVEEKMIVTKNQQQQQQHGNCESAVTVIDTKDDKELPRTQYTVHKGPILDIKVFENSFLAASEDGRIYRYNQASNGILNIYKGHKAAVTCLYVYNATCTDIIKEWMFSGSLDGTLRCYNITTGAQVRDIADIGSPIQCMDEAWGIIFIGTKSGHVSRYHMKSGTIKGNTIQFSDKSVLALKATNEGPRRVLIVASRSQPITIRDAQNGLFLRTICGQKNHTVYSLMRDNNLIYCGTSSTSIPVFDFTNGEQTMQYDAGVGIVCMRLYKQLLFAGCYDGNIYVFDTKDHRLVCSIPGPGNMLLSMEIIDNKIIAGSKDKRLQSWQMPRQVRSLL